MVLGFSERLEDVRVFLEKAANIPTSTKDRNRHGVKPPRGQKDAGIEVDLDSNETHSPRIIRFRNVFVKPLRVVADFVAPVHPKTASQKERLHVALKDNFVYLHLDKKTRDTLVDAMESIHARKGHVIIKQGDLGDYFYCIEQGTVRFQVDGQDAGTGGAGVCFGELALLHDCPRAATVICETKCTLWRVGQDVVRQLRAANALKTNREAQECVNMVSFLKDLSQQDKNQIASALEKRHFSANEVLLKKGDACQEFFIVKHGTVKATDICIGETRFDDLNLKCGDFAGQNIIKDGKPWPGDVVAVTDGVAYWLSGENYNKLLGGLDLDALVAKSGLKTLLQAIYVFANSNVDDVELDSLVDRIKQVEYKKSYVFASQGQVVSQPSIYIVVSGSVSISKRFGGSAKTLKTGEVFGHDWLVPERGRGTVTATHTITAAEDVVLAVLTLNDIVSVILDKSRLGRKTIKTEKKPGSSIKLDSLEKFRILGAGTFGQVWLVCESDHTGRKLVNAITGTQVDYRNKTAYALKIQYKRDLIGYNQVEGVINEKAIMQQMDHPFVMGLINSYKDDLCVYMLLKLFQGGELSSIIHTNEFDGIPEDEAVFYAAGVLEGLGYMHRRSIIHRDLKGENVMLDSEGYCVLIDLGFATVVKDKTFTCCGTPIFMAPEVLLGEGHNHGADLWSLGVLIYDMIVGYTPFYKPGMTHVDLYKRIVKGKFKFPSYLEISAEAQGLITSLLCPNQAFRLGCLTRGELDIRGHAWFLDMDFGKLLRKELQAPWVPNIKDPFDVSQFDDDWSKLENKKKNREPLTKGEQRYFDAF